MLFRGDPKGVLGPIEGPKAPKREPMGPILEDFGGIGGNVKTVLSLAREHHFWGRRGSREASEEPLVELLFRVGVRDRTFRGI